MAGGATRRLAWCVLAAVATGAAQADAQESPTEVAAAFFKAVAEERWSDAARHLDVAALDRYRREHIAAARLPQRRPPVITADDLLRHDPDMPREVAEYQARRSNERMGDPPSWIEHTFAVGSLDELAALSPGEAAARWLQARDVRWATRRIVERERARGCRVPAEAETPIVTQVHRVLATAVADSSTAYVVYEDRPPRRADPDAALDHDGVHVMTLRRHGGRWRISPRDGLFHGPIGISVEYDCRAPDRRPPK